MKIRYYKNEKAAAMHKETVEDVDWIDGFATTGKSEIVFKRTSDGEEISIPFSNFISAIQNKPKYWRFTNCDGTGGVILANTKSEAVQKLKEKYKTIAADVEVWKWTEDEYYDGEHPDVLNIYDC